MGDLVTIATYADGGTAAIARASLEAEGIDGFLQGAEASAMMWHVGSALGGVRLQVADHDVERALAVLHSGTPGENIGGPWYCGSCGERIDAGFDVCWMCGDVRGHSSGETPEPVTEAELESLAIADGEAESIVADEVPPTDWDAFANRTWRATLLGLVCPPVMVYAGFLLTQVLGRELEPRANRRVFAAAAIAVVYMAMILWLFAMAI